MECIFCNIELHELDNDYFCIECPYTYIRYSSSISGGPGYQYWNFYAGEYYVWVTVYNDGNIKSCVSNTKFMVSFTLNAAIKPCSAEKLKLYMLFS